MKKNDLKTGNEKLNSLLTTYTFDLNKKFSIWKREEYTEEQNEIFKALKVLGYDYITRDNDDDLCAYEKQPVKNTIYGYWEIKGDSDGNYASLPSYVSNTLDFILWEDEEPFEIPTL